RAPLLRECVQDGLADPPHRVGDELDVLLRVVLLRRLDQADVALVDQVEEEDVRVAITFGVGDDEAEVGLDQLFDRGLVVLLHTPTELALALRSETRNLRDLVKVLVEQIVRIVAFFVPGHALGTAILTRLRVASCALPGRATAARNPQLTTRNYRCATRAAVCGLP